MKLKVHNLTIYNLATNECSNYWWHEGGAHLEASVFATIIIKHLLTKCTEQIPIIIYSDGCGHVGIRTEMLFFQTLFFSFVRLKILLLSKNF